jgi:hypothetical protein
MGGQIGPKTDPVADETMQLTICLVLILRWTDINLSLRSENTGNRENQREGDGKNSI